MDKDEHTLDPWTDPSVEARLVALVLGEASEFEREELGRRMEEEPELAVFYRRMEAVHGLLAEAWKPGAEGEEWKLSPDRRAVLRERTGIGAVREPSAAAAGGSGRGRLRWRLGWQLAAAAAVVVLPLGAAWFAFQSMLGGRSAAVSFNVVDFQAAGMEVAAATSEAFGRESGWGDDAAAVASGVVEIGGTTDLTSAPVKRGRGLTRWFKGGEAAPEVALAAPEAPVPPVSGPAPAPVDSMNADFSPPESLAGEGRSVLALAEQATPPAPATEPAAVNERRSSSVTDDLAVAESAAPSAPEQQSAQAALRPMRELLERSRERGEVAQQSDEDGDGALPRGSAAEHYAGVNRAARVVDGAEAAGAEREGDQKEGDFEILWNYSKRIEPVDSSLVERADVEEEAEAKFAAAGSGPAGGAGGGVAGFGGGGQRSGLERFDAPAAGADRFYYENSNGVAANAPAAAPPGGAPGEPTTWAMPDPQEWRRKVDSAEWAAASGTEAETARRRGGAVAEKELTDGLGRREITEFMAKADGEPAMDPFAAGGAPAGEDAPFGETDESPAANGRAGEARDLALGDRPQLGEAFRQTLGGELNESVRFGADADGAVMDDALFEGQVALGTALDRVEQAAPLPATPGSDAPVTLNFSIDEAAGKSVEAETRRSLAELEILDVDADDAPVSVTATRAYDAGLVADESIRENAPEDLAKKLPEIAAAKDQREETAEELEPGVVESEGFVAGYAPSTGKRVAAGTEKLEEKMKQVTDAERGAEQDALAEVERMADRKAVELEVLQAAPAPVRQALMPMVEAAREPFSTFSLHVADVSFKLSRAALLERGEFPAPQEVRIEEFVNAFDYGDPAPSLEEKVACRTEQARHPFAQQQELLRIALRTAASGRAAQQPLRLTLLLDKSGSMEREDREATVSRALEALAAHLTENDQVTVVAFARQPRLLADRWSGARAAELADLVRRTPPEGGTNLEEALALGEQLALRQFAPEGQNRLILLTDGAANLGDIRPGVLRQRVVQLRQRGVAFDACGVGADGLNDALLEEVTREGDGRYYLLNRPEDADAGFARHLAGSLRPAARNVKVQVRFNPQRVRRYRLLGFEEHRLQKEDFRNDAVDAAELAAEEAGVALYAFETDANGAGEIGEVFVRFQDTATGLMVERSWVLPFDARSPDLDRAAPSLQLAAAAAFLAQHLGGREDAGQVELGELAAVEAHLRGRFGADERVQDLLRMLETARSLAP